MLSRVLRMSYCEFCSLRTRVPGFSDCNLRDLHKIDDSCLYNIPSKVRDDPNIAIITATIVIVVVVVVVVVVAPVVIALLFSFHMSLGISFVSLLKIDP